jgi:hypothetical protein
MQMFGLDVTQFHRASHFFNVPSNPGDNWKNRRTTEALQVNSAWMRHAVDPTDEHRKILDRFHSCISWMSF